MVRRVTIAALAALVAVSVGLLAAGLSHERSIRIVAHSQSAPISKIPSSPTQTATTPTAAAPMGTLAASVDAPISEVRANSGFHVLEPSYLPPGFALVRSWQMISQRADLPRVFATTLIYGAPGVTGQIAITQAPLKLGKTTFATPAMNQTLGDKPASITTKTITAPNAPGGGFTQTQVNFVQDGFLLTIQVPNLSLDEVGRIASSLR